MKRIFSSPFHLLLPLVFFGCSTETVVQVVPNPEIIHYSELPRPFAELIFYSYEYPDAKPVLERLLKSDIPVAAAWNATGGWDCPLRIPTYPQLIALLDSPDSRMADFGFSSDSTRLQIYGVTAGCKPYWEHYQFKE